MEVHMEKDKKVTALYCRLSKDDGSNSESLSIRTQKSMLMEYATRNGFGNCQYYVDDGYSGTNSDRPAFQELLDDIREGKVATVITKDQSRLGRNHIETGTYMEIFFPEHGVRYIAINDGYDSNEQSQMDIAPFRNIINEMYAKDTSRKIKSALRTRKKSGKYISSGAPFGYQKDPADHNHLVIDPNTAPVVEYIYSMAEEGLGLHRIAKRLHDEKVLKPCYYKKEMFGRFIDDEKMYDWDSAYISQVLHSPVYAGHIIYEAKPTVSMKSKKRRYIPFEERAIVPNTSRKSRFSTALSAHWMPSSNKVRKVTSENYPTDSGREGELIFRLVYQQAGCKKPFTRLWLSSMEENAIREGFAHLKPSTEYDALYNAALCRERADWMVGINASRLFSCLYGQPLAVGRVMTPVLAMTVVREAAIAAFVPEKFYTVDLELTSGCTASSRRIPEKSVAENLLKACRKEMVATIQRITRKEKSENPPSLYDLTTLQRDANRLLGYSAQQTLDYVQSLYEKKLTTYPRTDSCYITDDDEEMLEELTEELEVFLDITPEDVDEAVPRTRRTVNREKVTDHHAILPTRSMLQADLEALPKGEQNVLKLIIARTLMAVSKPFRYLETLLTTECAGEEFTAKGKEVLEEGWKAVERKVLADILNRKQELTALPNAAENECGILNAELKEGQTSPPKHFTEDLLLHAMETASADSMPEGVERQGIGTPATRAATIEKLVQKGFLERKGNKKTKVLLPTDKGKALITVMPEEIQSPEMTADWETKLLQIERGEMEPSEFMTEINTMITELVKNTEMKKGANALMKNKIIGVCPNCGKPVVEREKGWFCENRECRFVLWKDNAFFKRLGKRLDAHVADKLLRDGRVRLKDCKSAKGKTYNATVLLSCEADGRSKFSLEFEGGC
ncbi:MAG: DNA topoisomerase [Faecalibacterium prausnitzii]|nr:MAG: DNA topoisomerase [Faecalibacterium prausnitzii]